MIERARYSIHGIPNDTLTSDYIDSRRYKVSTLDSFSSAGAAGMAFARTVPISIPAGDTYSIVIQKNSNVAVRFINAEGLYIEAVNGSASGDLVGLDSLLTTNGIIQSDFIGLIEAYNSAPIGTAILGRQNELLESFYPDGQFVIALINNTLADVTTFLSIGIEQISESGVYSILEPTTQIEPTTEMSIYNGIN